MIVCGDGWSNLFTHQPNFFIYLEGVISQHFYIHSLFRINPLFEVPLFVQLLTSQVGMSTCDV